MESAPPVPPLSLFDSEIRELESRINTFSDGALSLASETKIFKSPFDNQLLAIAHRLEAATTARLSERQTRSRSPRAGRAGGGDRGARPMAAGGGGCGGWTGRHRRGASGDRRWRAN